MCCRCCEALRRVSPLGAEQCQRLRLRDSRALPSRMNIATVLPRILLLYYIVDLLVEGRLYFRVHTMESYLGSYTLARKFLDSESTRSSRRTIPTGTTL